MAALIEKYRVSPEVRSVVEETVREFVSQFALRDMEVRAGEDHYGEPALRIDVRHDFSATPIDPHALTALGVELHRRLLDLGEDRFPFVRHHFTDDQKVAGFK